jgi:hypothetical protein
VTRTAAVVDDAVVDEEPPIARVELVAVDSYRRRIPRSERPTSYDAVETFVGEHVTGSATSGQRSHRPE